MSLPRWLEAFGLSEPPFSKNIADDDLWMPSSKQVLVDELVLAVHNREHGLLVGEPGGGKTCTLRALRSRLPEAGFRLTYCHNATLGRRDFYRQLCVALGLSPKATAAAVFHTISTHVEQLGREAVHPVLLLDEAHLLRQDVLDHLHVLANYQWDQQPLLSIILVGLPELWDSLSLRKNRSLWSRIHHRVAIPPPGLGDTNEYVDYRIRQAGAKTMPFTSDALTTLHEGTGGQLRDIDRVATKALRAASRRKLAKVDAELLSGILEADQRAEARG